MNQPILVVAMDEEPILHILSDFLIREGYDPLTICDLKILKPIAVRLKPALIIIDMLMDDHSHSLELVKELREEGNPARAIPIILSSTKGRITGEEEQRLKEAHIKLVPKPFDTRHLAKEISAILAPVADLVSLECYDSTRL